MAQRDPFDMIQEPEPPIEPQRMRGIWWFAAVLLIAFVAFAGGMAYFTLSNRLPSPTPTVTPISTPVTPVAQIMATATTISMTLTVTTGASTKEGGNIPVVTTPTVAPPTATAIPATATIIVQPSPTTCAIALEGIFALVGDPIEVGCATGPQQMIWAAIETFEGGAMLWRSDTNAAHILVGTSTSGNWRLVSQRWDGQELPGRGVPPAGKFAPVRGFGYVWGTDDTVFSQLGWATQEELGFCALLQPFERGFIILSTPAESCTPENLYNRARDPSWRHFTLMLRTDGIWRSLTNSASQPTGITPLATPLVTSTSALPPVTPAGATPAGATPAVTPTSAGSTAYRSSANGVFIAPQSQPLALDARFDDWSPNWQLLPTIVQGDLNFNGPQDLGGRFQTRWSVDGLYLAVSVQDDVYRAGPEGSNMWQGDGLEIQLDRDLAGDFADFSANGDDFQLGVSFGPDLNQMLVYRWLPFALVAAMACNGAVIRTDQGYDL